MANASEMPGSLESYDAVPYSVSAFPQTDPDRLAVLAHVFNLPSAPPQNCRVLELGCAAGGNLIPMALAYPNSQFTGVDLSQRQIEDGNAVLRQLHVPNLKLLHLSITDITPALGAFDYILAHGVYSWVPPFVQDRTLEICRDNLTPTGVAYISYNTLPGWHVRGAIRNLVLHHTRDAENIHERLRMARATLAYHEQFYAASVVPFHSVLAREIGMLKDVPDNYLLHEYLEDCNEAVHFHEFMARAAAKDLQYLAEAEIATMLPARFGPETERVLRAMAPDTLALEQEMDYLRNRMFRQTLLCHRNAGLGHGLNAQAVADFHIASPMKSESEKPDVGSASPESFVDPGRPKVTSRTPLIKAAMVIFAKRWPLPVAFAELLAEIQALLGSRKEQDASNLAEGLMNCYTAGVVEFTMSPPRFITRVSERPVTSAYILLRAKNGFEVTNLRLESIALTQPARLVLSHLDGTHDKGSLLAMVTDLFNQMPPPASDKPLTETNAQRAARYIEYILPNFAQSALLIA